MARTMARDIRAPALLAGLVAVMIVVAGLAYWSATPAAGQGLVQFRNYDEYDAFLDRTGYYGGGGAAMFGDGRLAGLMGAEGDVSGTNVQVAGVDELDVVKADSTHVYVASGDKVLIVRATPADAMEVVGVINATAATGGRLVSAWVTGLFLVEDRVVVVISGWEAVDQTLTRPAWDIGLWYPGVGFTFVAAFDVSDVQAPALVWSHSVSGSPNAARLAEGHAYVVVVDWIPRSEEAYLTPTRCKGDACASMAVTSIWYDPESSEAGAVTHVLAVRLADGEADVMSVMGGAASTVYMTHTSLYLTVAKWDGGGPDIRTTIHKVSVDGLNLRPTAAGDVPGTLLNQWAMDESGGLLRVATTVGWQEPTSGVYVLDADLAVVGALEGLAPTERIFASRYLGDTLYLVTFRQIDPLFVIDLSLAAGPRVVGELKIPGFSAYLHPWTDGRLVGVGQEDAAMKLSLFDVSNPAWPAQLDAYVVPHQSWSPALWDHKAVLAEPAEDGLLVVPVDAAVWDPEGNATDSGAYVFRVASDALTLQGIVLHEEGGVQRALRIGDVLYTLSWTSLTASSLVDLRELGTLPIAPR